MKNDLVGFMKIETEITERDQAIMQGFADGKDDSMVASTMDVPLYTIRKQKQALMLKVGALNTANLVAIGFRNGIIK